ncbi:hypothetical protein BU24DRAFT_339297 [Aaosphaeria arxii CBS 175.79]|uniref:Nicotinamide N-methyltransferase n=1 Tax=Aaosphaeria arxii CBS 175.79 TaxID=1450172 RepID=A0A6A5Y547_9PLEO|nr:uncharacterized protein BU24DRAFT_339297 [Aaosphaeria arxii CBS 175.79]KAF2020396.1 hypothetical protein BU24DRAFT_339297 [Aaosphaeria arxii CBS 175.79]
MLLPNLVTLRYPTTAELGPEDILSNTLSSLYPDDLVIQHGDDQDTLVVYHNRAHGHLEFHTADVNGEEQRRKFAHYVWNASVLMGELIGGKKGEQRLEKNWRIDGETVLELGAGAGLAGIVSLLSGAKEVTFTDYPAPPIIETIRKNVAKNVPDHLKANISVEGHQWGELDGPFAMANAHKYTRILAADCLWMPWEHETLARSMLHFLSDSPDARIFCIAGFHTGRAKMAPFYEEVVPSAGLEVEEIYEMDARGRRRSWKRERDGGNENVGERKKWLSVARLRRAVRQ